MRFIYCMLSNERMLTSRQQGRIEAKKAEKVREFNEAMKEKQIALLHANGYKARL
jgi:hypothetical protein